MVGKPFKLSTNKIDLFTPNPFATEKNTPTHRADPKKKPTYLYGPFKPPTLPKSMGPSKTGCFSAYPAHGHTPYSTQNDKKRKYLHGPFKSPGKGKSYPVKSIVKMDVGKKINFNNFRNAVALAR